MHALLYNVGLIALHFIHHQSHRHKAKNKQKLIGTSVEEERAHA